MLEAARNGAAQAAQTDSLDLAKNVLRTGAIGGLATGGLLGLSALISRNRRRSPDSNPRIGAIRVPVEYPVKAASIEETLQNAGQGVKDFLTGSTATRPSGVWWRAPLAVAAGLGGVGLGMGTANMLSNYARKKEMQKDREAAEADFQKALMEQYTHPVHAPKMAETQKTAADVDAALDALEAKFNKLAHVLAEVAPQLDMKMASLADMGGAATGAYGTFALLAALAAGKKVYDWDRARESDTLTNKAIQERRRDEYLQKPPVFVAVPKPAEPKKPVTPIALDSVINPAA